MRAYADSSFILRLVVSEAGTDEAVAEYRRRGRPHLFYLALHALEVENAIRHRAFHERQVRPANERSQVQRECDAALTRLEQYRKRGSLTDAALDMELAFEHARDLSVGHTDRLGARAIDLLHVACAELLESELFLTFDERQLALARAVGLKVPARRPG